MGAFVDDVTLFHMSQPVMTLPELENVTSKELQLWVNLIWATGGKANLGKDKTYSAVMKWAFDKDERLFLMPQPGFTPMICEPPSGS